MHQDVLSKTAHADYTNTRSHRAHEVSAGGASEGIGGFVGRAKVKPSYFKSAAHFHKWLEAYHALVSELWVGFYKKDSGKGGLTYAEALDQALCFGWIDGIKKRVDEFSYTYRFTPRRPSSNWSLINIRHVERLKKAGRMQPAGLQAFAARNYRNLFVRKQNKPRKLSLRLERRFKSDPAAWDFFQRQPPGYRRLTAFWVMSAKREETRERRLARLMADSKLARRVGVLGGGK